MMRISGDETSMHANGKAKHYFSNPKYYTSATTGNVAFFQRSEDLESEPYLATQASPRGDTVLHIAARSGNDDLVGAILARFGSLVEHRNLMRNTPLHVAASAGHLSAAEALLSAAAARGIHLLRAENVEKNTALHLAVKNRHRDVARFLLENDGEVAHFRNRRGESPLLMAAEAGFESLFKDMMMAAMDEAAVGIGRVGGGDGSEVASYSAEAGNESVFNHMMASDEAAEVGRVGGDGGGGGGGDGADCQMLKRYRSKIVLAAITQKNIAILALTLSTWPEVFSTNDQMETITHPIFHATSVGFFEGVRDILVKFRESAFFVDKNGQFPIHVASMNGNIRMIQEFLKHCPDSAELCNNENQNILHLAAGNGKPKTVGYILKNPALEILFNEKDCNGNTPIHLAVEASHVRVVNIMARNSKIQLEIVNSEGLTALEVSEKFRQGVSAFAERLTWVALRHAGARRSHHRCRVRVKLSQDFYKERINTLMLVSTLIITITIAASLVSLEGGRVGKSKKAIAVFESVMLYPFVISNTLSMYCSMAVVLALIWAQFGDLYSFLSSLKYTLVLLVISLGMLSIAFNAGVYLTVRNHSIRLAISALIVGSICCLTLFSFLVPLFFKGRVANILSSYSMSLLEKLAHRGDPEFV